MNPFFVAGALLIALAIGLLLAWKLLGTATLLLGGLVLMMIGRLRDHY